MTEPGVIQATIAVGDIEPDWRTDCDMLMLSVGDVVLWRGWLDSDGKVWNDDHTPGPLTYTGPKERRGLRASDHAATISISYRDEPEAP